MLAVFSAQRSKTRSRLRVLLWPLAAIALLCFLLVRHFFSASVQHSTTTNTPLVAEHIDLGHGAGGRWYIPASWLYEAKASSNSSDPLISSTQPRNTLEAAQLALELSFRNNKFMQNSKIPLIVHQTWKNLDSKTWPEVVQNSVEGWLTAATGMDDPLEPEMAYILWDDDGIDALMKHYEPELWDGYAKLPYKVEKADTFRVVVLRWFGGVYADVDINLLQHPYTWIKSSDLASWTDDQTFDSYYYIHPNVPADTADAPAKAKRYQAPISSPSTYQALMAKLQPAAGIEVGAVFGIEADNPPAPDDSYWRMGYSFPVQLTNWAFAMAPHHPTAAKHLNELRTEIALNETRLPVIDPLDLTGPPALTKSVMRYCKDLAPWFRWDALSGRNDPPGGRGKVVAGDVLILPITAFSPGRGWFHNMGSKPLNHPNARLFHAAAGSWRQVSVRVHMGKLCRTFLGGCRDWKKIP